MSGSVRHQAEPGTIRLSHLVALQAVAPTRLTAAQSLRMAASIRFRAEGTRMVIVGGVIVLIVVVVLVLRIIGGK
jgi:hypothetical protein